MQEMTLDEYEKLREEKRANLNKPASKAATVDPKAFEGMKAYTRKVRHTMLAAVACQHHVLLVSTATSTTCVCIQKGEEDDVFDPHS